MEQQNLLKEKKLAFVIFNQMRELKGEISQGEVLNFEDYDVTTGNKYINDNFENALDSMVEKMSLRVVDLYCYSDDSKKVFIDEKISSQFKNFESYIMNSDTSTIQICNILTRDKTFQDALLKKYASIYNLNNDESNFYLNRKGKDDVLLYEEAILDTNEFSKIFEFVQKVHNINFLEVVKKLVQLNLTEKIFTIKDYFPKDKELIFEILKEIFRGKDKAATFNLLEKIEYLNSEKYNNIYSYFVDEAIKTKDENLIFEIIHHYSRDNREMLFESFMSVVKSKEKRLEGTLFYFMALNIPQAPIKLLNEGVAKYGSITDIYYFADLIIGANLSVLAEGLLGTENDDKITTFLCMYCNRLSDDVKKKIINYIIDSEDKGKNTLKAIYVVDDLNASLKEELRPLLFSKLLKVSECKYIFQYARTLYEKNKKEDEEYRKIIMDEIIKRNDPEIIFYLASEVKNTPIPELTKAMVNTKNAEYILLFAKKVPNASYEVLADGLADESVDDIASCVEFANNIFLTDKLEEKILKSKDYEKIYDVFLNKI